MGEARSVTGGDGDDTSYGGDNAEARFFSSLLFSSRLVSSLLSEPLLFSRTLSPVLSRMMTMMYVLDVMSCHII